MPLMIAWCLGGLVAFVVFLASTLLVFFKLVIFPRLLPKLPDLILPEPIAWEYSEQDSIGAAESAEWLNALLNWLAANFLEIPQVQERIKRLIEEGVVDIRRGALGKVLVNSELLQVDFGTSAPAISNVRRFKNSTVVCDFEFNGGIELLIRLHFIHNFRVSLQVRIDSLSLPVAVILKERALYLSFVEEARSCLTTLTLSFQHSESAHYTVPLLNHLLSTKIVPRLLSSALLRPKTLGFWYRSAPPQPPYPWTPLSDPSMLYTWRP